MRKKLTLRIRSECIIYGNRNTFSHLLVQLLSCVRLFAIPWTVACKAPLSLGFSRQQYWSGLLFPSPGDLLNPGIEPASLALQADSLLTELLFSIEVQLIYNIAFISAAQHQNKQPSQKMGRKPKQTFLERRHTDGQEAQEEMFNTTEYQRNANKNYSEVYHLIPASMAIIKKNLQRVNAGEGVEKREPSYTVGGNGNWETIWENGMEIP